MIDQIRQVDWCTSVNRPDRLIHPALEIKSRVSPPFLRVTQRGLSGNFTIQIVLFSQAAPTTSLQKSSTCTATPFGMNHPYKSSKLRT